MATTTPNFGWPVPTSTDLVKDGATAIEGLGDAIDASLLDLKGGTTNQVLAKNSNTDMDFKWVADASGIPATIIDAKGDLIAGTAADTAARLAVGTNGQVLTADSAEATGLKWATAAGGGGGMTLISTTTLSGASTTISVASNSYINLMLYCDSIDCSTNCDVFVQINGETGSTAYSRIANGSYSQSTYTAVSYQNGIMLNLQGNEGLGTGNDNFTVMNLPNANSTIRKLVDVSHTDIGSGNMVNIMRNTTAFASTAVISSIVFKTSAGTFDGGSIRLYGVK